MKKGLIYKVALSTASLAMIFGLAGCGKRVVLIRVAVLLSRHK